MKKKLIIPAALAVAALGVGCGADEPGEDAQVADARGDASPMSDARADATPADGGVPDAQNLDAESEDLPLV